MRWRKILGWTPVSLFALLAAAGVGFVAAESWTPGVLLVGTLDGAQLGSLLIVLALGSGVVALVQATVLASRLRRPFWRVLIRLIAGLLLAAALPFGYALMFVAAFAAANSYQVLDVPGHRVAVRTFTWHHRSIDILEQDGMFFRPVALCGNALPLDGYDAFSAGQYETISRAGHTVVRFAQTPGEESYGGAAVLGTRPGDDVSASCGAN